MPGANRSRKQMTADIAHDLRNPLTVLSGYLESCKMESSNLRLNVLLSCKPKRLTCSISSKTCERYPLRMRAN
ncbi:MAG: hypothetical protein IPG80_00830 [Anaerolineales bacterium]|nr:hypothetical protein [Anaerolineales bacterium]